MEANIGAISRKGGWDPAYQTMSTGWKMFYSGNIRPRNKNINNDNASGCEEGLTLSGRFSQTGANSVTGQTKTLQFIYLNK